MLKELGKIVRQNEFKYQARVYVLLSHNITKFDHKIVSYSRI